MHLKCFVTDCYRTRTVTCSVMTLKIKRVITVFMSNEVIKSLPVSVLITEMRTWALIIIFLESKPVT